MFQHGKITPGRQKHLLKDTRWNIGLAVTLDVHKVVRKRQSLGLPAFCHLDSKHIFRSNTNNWDQVSSSLHFPSFSQTYPLFQEGAKNTVEINYMWMMWRTCSSFSYLDPTFSAKARREQGTSSRVTDGVLAALLRKGTGLAPEGFAGFVSPEDTEPPKKKDFAKNKPKKNFLEAQFPRLIIVWKVKCISQCQQSSPRNFWCYGHLTVIWAAKQMHADAKLLAIHPTLQAFAE